IALSSSSTWLVLRAPATSPATSIVMAGLVDGHMRALAAPQPIDVVSSDKHTVKPWFIGKIPQSPKVVDLAGEGFPLVGGRIDVFGKTPVPTLVYSRRLHLISLTAVSSSSNVSNPHSSRPVNGFNIVSWNVGEMTYWAISDLNVTELNAFAKLFQQAS
ncbi:MAG: anti-sigma factor, partial [Alphaproteobacteria bacterium]|nr:anti-sigma factor [Alphaproteobacteria bacterium]